MAKTVFTLEKLRRKTPENILEENVVNTIIVVNGDRIPLDLLEATTIDNYYLREGYTTVGELLLNLLSTSTDNKVNEIHALITGEKHILSTLIRNGEIEELEIRKKIN